MAGESVFATQWSSPQTAARSADLRVTTTGSMLAARSIADHKGEADRGDLPRVASIADGITSSTLVEPVSIAVFGFTAAALIAVRRRKNAAAEAGLADQRIS